ncbi:WD40 repeat-like-containing domain protein [Cordyceps fumosorosea ARSEF 2679]|uniref:WD40 repeat-like-containing domain protein n=1 Tax=Cordyceps fumosorosea (strain ARSEF 2679) TaxID=1081104 RepID=A0A167TP55_CORFA|nr:WD40 repeat-like-containing domain protein [Cordyceps fumosorosea ARSEF 2679]OAA60801.1 WD40 repeat-like-containing domain protein [Cordyceps fumosorosea ARSEF 2679]
MHSNAQPQDAPMPPQMHDASPSPSSATLIAQCAANCTATEPSRFFYSSAQWTADGTSLLVGSSDSKVSTFVLPSNLLEADTVQPLQPQASIQLPEPSQCIVSAPYFSLSNPATQTFLVGSRDHPLQLYHAFPTGSEPAPLCMYKLMRHETEAYITPSSMLWPSPGTHFFCGSANRIDYFDVSRPGSDGPVHTIHTIPSKRHLLKGGGVGMKGTVSALSNSPADAPGSGIVAAGTWTRWMGLYDMNRADKAVANWSIADADLHEFGKSFGGQGIMQTRWSPCGRYLVINERHASGLLVYDIRGNGKLLTVLAGRDCSTQQRLTCDAFGIAGDGPGFELWAGTESGSVKVWDEVGLHYGVVDPKWSWDAHEAPIGSTIVHPSGSVVASCAGAWCHPSEEDIDSTEGGTTGSSVKTTILDGSAIKLWSVTSQQASQ